MIAEGLPSLIRNSRDTEREEKCSWAKKKTPKVCAVQKGTKKRLARTAIEGGLRTQKVDKAPCGMSMLGGWKSKKKKKQQGGGTSIEVELAGEV